MTSSPRRNPSLTYIARSVRATDYAVRELKRDDCKKRWVIASTRLSLCASPLAPATAQTFAEHIAPLSG